MDDCLILDLYPDEGFYRADNAFAEKWLEPFYRDGVFEPDMDADFSLLAINPAKAEDLIAHCETEPAFREYLEIIGKCPLLTDEEEKKLLPMAAAEDQKAKERLVEGNLLLAATIVREYPLSGEVLLLAAIAANEGLMRGVEEYLQGGKTSFCGYLAWRIRADLLKWMVESGNLPEKKVRKKEISGELDLMNNQALWEAVLEAVTPRERDILILRRGTGDHDRMSREAVAAQYGVSPERIRMVEQKAIRKARRILRGHNR